MGLAEAYDYAAGVMVENMLARDAEEGIGAFLEKRHPTGRIADEPGPRPLAAGRRGDPPNPDASR